MGFVDSDGVKYLGNTNSLEKAQVPEPYKMPKPSFGLVYWKPSPHSKDLAVGIVTKVGDNAINVMVMPDGGYRPVEKNGVRHVSDEGFARLGDQRCGVWDFTDADKELAALRAKK
jgi:hypothetical protein